MRVGSSPFAMAARLWLVWAQLQCLRGEDQICAANSQAASCQCQDGENDEACETRLFTRLADWVQTGVDQYVPDEYRADVPRISDVLKMVRQEGERIVAAGRALEEGELLLRLPRQRLMHNGFYRNGNESKLIAALSAAMQDREWEFYIAPQTWLALYMLEQRRLGQSSQWSLYMDLLPQTFPSVPIFYEEEELRWLEGSLFASRVRKHQKSLEQQFRTVGELVPGFGDDYALHDFRWARSAISSRVFGWPLPDLPSDQTEFMVPLGDMFNHRSPKQVEWIYNETTDTFDYWVRENVSEGSEVLISYGAKCNSGYLLHYGFALPGVNKRNPPLSTARVALDLDSEVPDRDAREKWLLKKRLREDEDKLAPEEFELKLKWRGSDVEKLLGYARLISLESEDFERLAKSKHRRCSAFKTPPQCISSMSLRNERAALQRVLSALDAQLAGYPTTLEEDEALLPSLSGVPRSLVLLRRDEKFVLRRWRRVFGVFVFAGARALELSEEELEAHCRQEFSEDEEDELRYVRVQIFALASVERNSITK